MGASSFAPSDKERSSFSLEHQARLLASLGHAVIATDASGAIRFWNHAAEQLYGWSASEVIGQDVTTVTPVASTVDEARDIMKTLVRGENWRGTFPLRRRDGTTFLADVTDTPVFDDEGHLVGIVGVSVDVTARRRSEERARFVADAARALAAPLELDDVLRQLATLPIPALADFTVVYRVSGDGMTHRVARSHVDPTRQHLLDELEARYPLNADSDYPGARAIRNRQTVFSQEMGRESWGSGVPEEGYAEIVASLDPSSVIAAPLIARGRAQGALVLAMTRAEAGGSGRRFEQEDLQTAESLAGLGALALDNVLLLQDADRARGQAEEANRAKSAFLASLSHEVRTPLNAIAGYVELIEMGLRGPITEAQRADLARVRRSQQHLLGLIDNVLNFVRLDTGHLRYTIDDVPLSPTFQRVEELVLPQLQAKGLRYARDPEPSTLSVRADSEKLRQILVNLLTNAIKFTESGGEIVLSHGIEGAMVRIAVRDTGSGIPADKLDAVFEPFIQVGSSPGEGVGLGLAISRELARHMGGDIVVESESGVGSTFALTLPPA